MRLLGKVRTPAIASALFVFVSVMAVFRYGNVRAEAESFWAGAADPLFLITNDDYQPPREAGRYCTHRDLIVSVKVGSFPTVYGPTARNECVITTDYGTVSEGKLLQFTHDRAAYYINMHPSTQPVEVPAAQSYFYTSTIGNGNRGLFAIDQPAASFATADRVDDYERVYELKFGVTPRALKHTASDQFVIVRAIDASADGRWIIAELTNGRLARIDAATFETLVFPASIPAYGAGNNPSLDLAISNDGRYVAMAGSNVDDLHMFDLSTCSVPDPADNLSVATGCEVKSLGSFLQDRLAGVFTAQHLRFISDGSHLSMTVTQTGLPYARVLLRAPAVEHAEPLKYLALGDSFASGEGELDSNNFKPLTNGEENPDEVCHVSKRSYPYLLADRLGLDDADFADFENVACSGARMNDALNTSLSYTGQFSQFKGKSEGEIGLLKEAALSNFTPGRAVQLQFVERYQPKVVTISIGGNDANLLGKMEECVTSDPPICRHSVEGADRDKVAIEIAELVYKKENLPETYATIRNASPDTRIYVVGYPQIIDGESAGCGFIPGLQLTVLHQPERELAAKTISYLNDIVEASARAAGVQYIDTESAFGDKILCGNFPAHVNGISFFAPFNENEKRKSFHPNHYGHNALANRIQEATNDFATYCGGTAVVNCPRETVELPDIPEYFRTTNDDNLTPPQLVYFAANGTLPKHPDGSPMDLRIYIHNLKPHAVITPTLFSEPRQLGTFTADESGVLDVTVQIPDDIPAGYHTLHAFGVSPSGEQLDLYQPLFIKGLAGDVDEDDVPDGSDPCLFIQPANSDFDLDGTDDACDLFIDEQPMPTVVLPGAVNAANQTSVTVSGKGRDGMVARISVDDENPATNAISAEAEVVQNGEGGHEYSRNLDLFSLDNGAVTVTVRLQNEFGAGPEVSETIAKDTVLPATAVIQTPVPNGNGWHKQSVMVGFDAADIGTGVKELIYSASGAQTIGETAVGSGQASFAINAEGVTSIRRHAVDNAGNSESEKSLIIKIDKTNPAATINQPPFSMLVPLFGQRLTGSSSDNLSGIEKTEVTLTNTITGQVTRVQASCTGGCTNPATATTWSADVSGVPLGSYGVSVQPIDIAGNQSQPTAPVNILLVGL